MKREKLHTITQRIATLAKRNKITQTDLAKKCDLSRITICRYLGTKTDIRSEDFIKLLKTFDIDVEQLLEEKLNNIADETKNQTSPMNTLHFINPSVAL